MRSRDEGRFRSRRPCWARWTGRDVDQSLMKKSWLDAVKMVNAMDPEEVYGYRIEVNVKRDSDKAVKASKAQG